MGIDEEKKRIFVTTVCPICGLCKKPNPDFCALLYYNGNSEQFTKEIVNRINRLRNISPNLLEILHTFEGFSSLFCRPNRCPLYDKQCETKLFPRVTCYRSFIKQNDEQVRLFNPSNIYRKWSGISLREIGKDLDPIMDVPNDLTKGQRKKLRKAIKKAKKRIDKETTVKSDRNNTMVLYKSKKSTEKVVETLFFCNSNDEWKEKISQYLEKDG